MDILHPKSDMVLSQGRLSGTYNMQHDIPEVVPRAGEVEALWSGNLFEA